MSWTLDEVSMLLRLVGLLVGLFVGAVLACGLAGCDDDNAKGADGRSDVDVDASPDTAGEEVRDGEAADATEETSADAAPDALDTGDVADVPLPTDPIGSRFPANVPAGFTLHDLGTFATTDGETEDVTFDVPAGAVTLHVTLATDAGSTVVLLGAVSPTGEWVVFDTPPDGADTTDADALGNGFGGGMLSPNKAVGLPRATTALIPNSPRVVLTPGRWTFRAGSFDMAYDVEGEKWIRTPVERDLRIGMLVRTTPVPTEGAIDLLLSFDASSGLSAESAPDDAEIIASLDILEGALDSVGLSLGEVTYRDVALTTSTVALRVPACNMTDDIAKVFDEAPAPRNDVIQVVFLGRFTCPQLGGIYDLGDSLAALSIGAPGTPFSTRSGIIASTFAKPTYPVEWAEVVAHETGHFLGLFHTREVRGDIVDNIADTAEDERGAAANIMFHNVTLSTATTFTPDQGTIVRSSPLVHPVR